MRSPVTAVHHITLRVSDLERARAFYARGESLSAPELPAVRWHDVMTELEGVVTESVARDGAFRVDACSGVFVCRKAGP